MNKFKKKIKSFFFRKEDKKPILNLKRIKYLASFLFITFTIAEIFWPRDDTNLSKSNSQLTVSTEQAKAKMNVSGKASEVINNHQRSFEAEQRRKALRNRRKVPLVPPNVNFNAKQVITRTNGEETGNALPGGTNIIGKLLNGIDTRNKNQPIKVILPYGARHKSGASIPRDTVLIGRATYSGHGKKVFLKFNKAIYPMGSEHKIEAQGLSSSDYSPGLVGKRHSNVDLKIAAQVGLTMISAATDVMTGRTQAANLADQGVAINTPDATLENAALQGVSQVARNEANQQAQEMSQQSAYVTIEAGSDLIISLTSSFNGGN